LNSNVTGPFNATDCQQVVLYPGDYLINAAGDTLFFNPGDTVSLFSDGTVQINEFRPSVGISNATGPTFKVYPNPTTGVVSVSVGGVAPIQGLSIINLLGETVFNQSTNLGSYTTVDVSSLIAGIYLVQLKTAQGISVQRLVIE
jgi:hypothetical protein